MNSRFRLFLNGRLFDPGAIEKKLSLPEEAGDDNARYVVDFCRKWAAGEPAFAIDTSGSTGAPKRITLSRTQMQSSAEATARALGLKRGDHALLCLSPRHIGGLMMLVRALHLGLTLFVEQPSSNPFATLRRHSDQQIDFAAFVPLQVRAMLAAGPDFLRELNGMKAILVGGAPVSSELRQSIAGLRVPVLQTFGMTETVSHIALRRLSGEEAEEAYRALPGVKLDLDERGCLKIKAAATGNHWVVSNDVVRLLPPDRFIWLGRADNVINSGGVKVYAEKVEKALREALAAMPGVAVTDCFVAGFPDDKLGEKVVAVFAASEFSAQTKCALLERLAAALAKYELPKEFLYVDEFCRTANGKLDRRATLDKIRD